MQDRIRNYRVSDFDKLTVQPVNCITGNKMISQTFSELEQQRKILYNSAKTSTCPSIQSILVRYFFGAAHILQWNLLGQIPSLRPVRFHRNDYMQIWHYNRQITVAKGTDETSVPHFKHQTTLLSWITRPRLSFGCICINASTCSSIYYRIAIYKISIQANSYLFVTGEAWLGQHSAVTDANEPMPCILLLIGCDIMAHYFIRFIAKTGKDNGDQLRA